MRLLIIALSLILSIATSATAAPGDIWEGTWRNSDHKTIWLFQDGDRVWGSASHSYRYVAQVSPDGRTIRGTYFKNSSNQGLFEWTLEANSDRFTSDYRRKSSSEYPVSIPGRGYGYRNPTDLDRFDYIANGFADGTQDFDSPLNRNDPADMAWINYQSPYPQPDAPMVDISDLEIPAPGNAGLWQVLNNGNQQIGTVAMNETTGGFTASGQIRLTNFQAGTPLLATFTEDYSNTTLDSVRFDVVAGNDNQTNTVDIRPEPGEAYTVSFVTPFLGVDNYTMRLVWIEGSIPADPPADISGLTIPAPGTLGLMQVTLNGQRIGTVNWDQPDVDVTMTGQVVLPAYNGDTPWDVSFVDRPGILNDQFNFLHAASGTAFFGRADIEEKEGDQYFVRFGPGSFSPMQTREETLVISHIPGSRPGATSAPSDDLYTLRIDTDRVPAGLAVAVYDAPMRGAAVIGMLAPDATGLRLQRCEPNITEDQLRLSGEDLYNVLADMFCRIEADSVTGWVGGAYLTR